MHEPKACPVLMNGVIVKAVGTEFDDPEDFMENLQSTTKCMEDVWKCAWWIKEKRVCAITLIALALSNIAYERDFFKSDV